MRLPKEISIGGSIWKIKKEHLPTLDGEVVAAYTDPNTKYIVFCDTLQGDWLEHVFFHEFNHAVMAEMGLHNCNVSDEVEEIIVDNMARIYLQTFKMSLKCRKKKR